MTAVSTDETATVHVLVTCTNRKSVSVPSALHLDNASGHTLGQRSREWIRRLVDVADVPLVAADRLYLGEHWKVARGLRSLSTGNRVRLWVCSAGYGLIPAEALLRPYAATFTGQADRVPGGSEGARDWWQALAAWAGPAPKQPRTIRLLAAGDPSAYFMVVLSPPYLDACRDDIAAAAAAVTDPQRFVVISAGARHSGPLANLIVPADARLQAFLGGTRQALNVRIADHLLSAGIGERARASQHLAQLLAKQAPISRYERKQLSDQEVREMISHRLTQVPGMSASKMLREFRDAGFACEQSRFARLHHHIVSEVRA
jgi:hypothetical protein